MCAAAKARWELHRHGALPLCLELRRLLFLPALHLPTPLFLLLLLAPPPSAARRLAGDDLLCVSCLDEVTHPRREVIWRLPW